MMPRLDGFGLLCAIRADKSLADIPVVLLSARADEEAKLEGFSTADDYLVKPFNARELLARIGANLNLAELRKQAAIDLRDTRCLHEVAERLLRTEGNFEECLELILDSAIEITGADKGNMQIFEPASDSLQLTVQRGFEKRFLDYFACVRQGDSVGCATAMKSLRQVVVDDVTQSDIFAGEESLNVLLSAGVRAVQSTPLFGADGEIVGMISTHFAAPHRPSERQLRCVALLARHAADYLERRHFEQAREQINRTLRYRTEQFATLLNQAPMGVYLVDSAFRIREMNPASLSAFGNIPGGLIGRDFGEIIHIVWPKEYADEIVALFRHTLETGESWATSKRGEVRADRGETEHYAWRVDRITLPDGSHGVVCYFHDISEQVKADETRQLLLRELNHRVKNTLASVQAIARQTLLSTKEPTEFAARFSGRLQSMARVHALLTESTWKGADLREVIRDQLLHGHVDESRLTAWGPAVHLQPQQAVHLAVILHELGTNSIKYGALSVTNGWVTVNWTIANDVLNLRWAERGGPMVSAPSRRGFGTTLIEQSAKSEGGKAEQLIEHEGVTWKISLRLPDAAIRGEADGVQPELINRPATSAQLLKGARASPFAGLRFLVVEDESLIALDLVDRLEKLGAETQSVSTEDESLALIEQDTFDCALLDANLHGRSVEAVAAALTRRKISFVFVTGYGRAGLPAAFTQAPALAKPVSDEQLLEAVMDLVSRQQRVVRLQS
jgi:PAS domain S-box-containing protein